MSSSSSQSVTPKSYVAWYKEYLRLYKPVYKNPTPADRGRLVALNSKGKLNPSLFEPPRSIIATNYDLTPISDQINPVVATLDHFLNDFDVLVEVYDSGTGVLLPDANITLLSSDSLQVTLPIQTFSGAWPIRVVVLSTGIPVPAVVPSSSSSLSQVGTNSNSSKSSITSDSSLSSITSPSSASTGSSASYNPGLDSSSQSLQSESSYVNAGAFRILIDTTQAGSASDTFILPTTGAGYDAEVDWGDSNTQTISGTPGNVSHTYAAPGVYTVSITENSVGGFPRIYFNFAGDRLKVKELRQWGSNTWVSMARAFAGCGNLKITASDSATAVTGSVTDFKWAWANCLSIDTFPLLNTSSATDMSGAWQNNTSLTSFPAIDTSSCLNLNTAWFQCTGLISLPLLDTSSVTTAQSTWEGCTSLTSFPALNLSSCTDLFAAWRNCTGLTSFPEITLSVISTLTDTWRNCSNMVSFGAISTASCIDFSNTWSGCSSLTSFPMINTGIATSLTGTWSGCSSLTSFPSINTTSVTSLTSTWSACSSLTSFPAIDTSNCIDMQGTWAGCSGLTSFPSINTGNVTNFDSTWESCNSLGSSFPVLDFHSATLLAICSSWGLSTAIYNEILVQLAYGLNSVPANTNTGVSAGFGTSEEDSGSGGYDGSGALDYLVMSLGWTIGDGHGGHAP